MKPDKCSHGVLLDEPCIHCELVSAQKTIKNLGPIVEKAQRRIAEIERELSAKEAKK